MVDSVGMSPLATVKQYSPLKRTAPVHDRHATPVSLTRSLRFTALSEITGPAITTQPSSTSFW